MAHFIRPHTYHFLNRMSILYHHRRRRRRRRRHHHHQLFNIGCPNATKQTEHVHI